MTYEIQFRMRVSDLLWYVEHEFGGLEQLEKYLSKHEDPRHVIIYEALARHRDRPSKVLTFGRLYLGEGERGLSPAKLEVLQRIMGSQGLSVRELARAMRKDPATISEHLKELEKDALVVKEDRGRGRSALVRPVPVEINIRLTRETEEATA